MRTISLGISLLLLLNCLWVHASEPESYDISTVRQDLDTFAGKRIRLENVVCFIETPVNLSYSTYVQDTCGGPWSGTLIYDEQERLIAIKGQMVTAVGIVEVSTSNNSFRFNVSLEEEFPPEITGSAPVPDPIQVTCATAVEGQYEDCMICIKNVEITSQPDLYGCIDIQDWYGAYELMLRSIDPAPPIGQVYQSITGLNLFWAGSMKIRPRDENDWNKVPDFGVEIHMPIEIHPGENFFVQGIINNPDYIREDAPVFFFLGIQDQYWFWPSFVSSEIDVDYRDMSILKGRTEVTVINEMIWPDTGDLAMNNLAFYGAVLNQDLSGIIGNYTVVYWRFGP